MSAFYFLIGLAGGIYLGWREVRRLRARYLRIGEDCRELIADNARLRHQNRRLQRDVGITDAELAELARRNS